MEVRNLAVKDAMALARMFLKLKFRPKAEDESTMLYGQAILTMVVENCGEEALAWLATMVNMTKEEFDEQPASAIVDTIQAIMAQDGAKDFFSRVWGLIPRSSSSASAGETTLSSDSASGAT